MLTGFSNAPLLALLWALYLSFTHVGQIFYGYGWDSLLCETGFLAIFLAPALRPREFDPSSPPSQIVLEVLPGNVYKVNSQPIGKNELQKRLKEIYDPRPEKIIFVKGDPAVKYSDVIWAMDAARGAGVKVIGVPPKDVK